MNISRINVREAQYYVFHLCYELTFPSDLSAFEEEHSGCYYCLTLFCPFNKDYWRKNVKRQASQRLEIRLNLKVDFYDRFSHAHTELIFPSLSNGLNVVRWTLFQEADHT